MNSRTKQYTVLALLLASAGFTAHNAQADYAAYISTTSPVGWWGMNETGLSAVSTADLSGAFGAANNGQGVNINLNYNNPGVTTVTGQPGFVNSAGSNFATQFLGTGPSPGVASAGATGNGAMDDGTVSPVYRYSSAFSVEAWINLSSTSNGSDSERVVSNREFAFGFSSGGGLHFTTVGKQDYFGGAVAGDSQWHQIGVSWDATSGPAGVSEATFYIDGVVAGVADATAGTSGIRAIADPGFNTMNLGRRTTSAAGQQLTGLLDEVVIWNTPRTAQDFADSYAAATVPEPGSLALLGLGVIALAARRRCA